MINKAHLIIQLEDSTINESTLLIVKGRLIKILENNGVCKIGKGSKLDLELVIDDFSLLDSVGTGFTLDKAFVEAFKDMNFRVVKTDEEDLKGILERQIEF